METRAPLRSLSTVMRSHLHACSPLYTMQAILTLTHFKAYIARPVQHLYRLTKWLYRRRQSKLESARFDQIGNYIHFDDTPNDTDYGATQDAWLCGYFFISCKMFPGGNCRSHYTCFGRK